jgi:hypothetical protein
MYEVQMYLQDSGEELNILDPSRHLIRDGRIGYIPPDSIPTLNTNNPTVKDGYLLDRWRGGERTGEREREREGWDREIELHSLNFWRYFFLFNDLFLCMKRTRNGESQKLKIYIPLDKALIPPKGVVSFFKSECKPSSSLSPFSPFSPPLSSLLPPLPLSLHLEDEWRS